MNAIGNDRYKKLSELVKKTHKEKPKTEDIAALRRFFDEDPNLWQATGNMAKRTLDHLCRTYYQQSAYVQECVLRRVELMREQLGFAEASPLERPISLPLAGSESSAQIREGATLLNPFRIADGAV